MGEWDRADGGAGRVFDGKLFKVSRNTANLLELFVRILLVPLS